MSHHRQYYHTNGDTPNLWCIVNRSRYEFLHYPQGWFKIVLDKLGGRVRDNCYDVQAGTCVQSTQPDQWVPQVHKVNLGSEIPLSILSVLEVSWVQSTSNRDFLGELEGGGGIS